MIDLHTHSIFSDGELIPVELVRRAIAKGYEGIAITDHMDHSNIDLIIPRIVKAVDKIRDYMPICIYASLTLNGTSSPCGEGARGRGNLKSESFTLPLIPSHQGRGTILESLYLDLGQIF